MSCIFSPPFLILNCFNYDALAKCEVAQSIRCLLSYSVSTADTLRYAVTLTTDPVTLTFDLSP